MKIIVIPLPEKIYQELLKAARSQNRSLRQLIKNVLRKSLRKSRGIRRNSNLAQLRVSELLRKTCPKKVLKKHYRDWLD